MFRFLRALCALCVLCVAILATPACVLYVALLATPACGGSGAKAESPQHRVYKARLEALKTYVYSGGTLHLPDAIESCEALAGEAAGTPYAEEANALKLEAEQLRQSAQSAALEKVKKQVDGFLDKQDYGSALGVLGEVDPAYKDHPLYQALMGRKEEIRTFYRAKILAEHILAKTDELIGQSEFEKAAGMLKAFYLFNGFEGTTWAKGIRERQEALDKAKAAAPKETSFWETVFNGKDLYNWEFGEGGTLWRVDDGEMVGDNDTPDRVGSAVADAEGWIDYQISFSFKIEKGGFELGVRGERQAGERRWFTANVTASGQDDGLWHSVKVSVKGIRVEWTRMDLGETRGSMLTNEKGPMGFILLPRSTVRFKDIRVKVTSRDESAAQEAKPQELGGESWGGEEGFEGGGEDDDEEDK